MLLRIAIQVSNHDALKFANMLGVVRGRIDLELIKWWYRNCDTLLSLSDELKKRVADSLARAVHDQGWRIGTLRANSRQGGQQLSVTISGTFYIKTSGQKSYGGFEGRPANGDVVIFNINNAPGSGSNKYVTFQLLRRGE